MNLVKIVKMLRDGSAFNRELHKGEFKTVFICPPVHPPLNRCGVRNVEAYKAYNIWLYINKISVPGIFLVLSCFCALNAKNVKENVIMIE